MGKHALVNLSVARQTCHTSSAVGRCHVCMHCAVNLSQELAKAAASGMCAGRAEGIPDKCVCMPAQGALLSRRLLCCCCSASVGHKLQVRSPSCKLFYTGRHTLPDRLDSRSSCKLEFLFRAYSLAYTHSFGLVLCGSWWANHRQSLLALASVCCHLRMRAQQSKHTGPQRRVRRCVAILRPERLGRLWCRVLCAWQRVPDTKQRQPARWLWRPRCGHRRLRILWRR